MATTTMSSITGVSSGIDTTALINAIVGQKSGNLNRLKARRDLNDKKTAALTALKTSLQALTLSMAVLQDKFNSRTVTSSDANNTYVTATGSGAASGNYDLTVSTVATKARISASPTAELAVASLTDTIFTGTARFAVRGTDNKTYAFDVTDNTLTGLRDAINAQTASGVTATIVNTGSGAKPYQLVISAKTTGTGETLGDITIADVTNNDGLTTVNSIGIKAGTVSDLTGTPETLTGGLTSTDSGAKATDARFTLNGIELTRTTNTIKDAAEGMTFSLKQGGQTGITTLSVAPDKAGATLAMQDFITKYNALLKDYKAASTSTKNADGSVNEAALANDPTTRALLANLKATLVGTSTGMPEDAAYKTLASMGITSLADGGLYLNTNAFQTAMANDLTSVQLNFSQGVGKSANDLLTNFTTSSSGLTSILNSITNQNKNLGSQIVAAQSRLDRETDVLKKKFARMEAIVGQMRASAGALSSM